MFKISGEKEVKLSKTIKLAPSLIKRIEEEARKNNISFSGFVREACIYALSNMENEKDLK